MSYDLCHCPADICAAIPRDPKTGICVACGDFRELRDYTSAERKAAPVWAVMAEYFPDAFMALARLSKKANDKHNPGEPMHWARGKSTDQLDCAARHMLTPDRIDPETGEIELVAAFWRLGAEVQLREEKRLVAAGIRPLSGVIHPALDAHQGARPGPGRHSRTPNKKARQGRS